MTEAELLNKVKYSLGITGTYQDETLRTYIREVKEYLQDAGIPVNIVNSAVTVGVISRGVADLWNYGSGGTELSEYFMQRVIQLKYRNEE